MISPLRQQEESRNLGHTFLPNSVMRHTGPFFRLSPLESQFSRSLSLTHHRRRRSRAALRSFPARRTPPWRGRCSRCRGARPAAAPASSPAPCAGTGCPGSCSAARGPARPSGTACSSTAAGRTLSHLEKRESGHKWVQFQHFSVCKLGGAGDRFGDCFCAHSARFPCISKKKLIYKLKIHQTS